MNRPPKSLEFLLCLVCSTSSLAVGNPAQADEARQRAFFEARIRPVLIKHCYECHSAESDEVKGGLRVDSSPGLLTGGDSGPAIVAGKPDESPLIEALRYDGLEMPPAGRLPKQVVQDFEQWVESGAFDPRSTIPESTASSSSRSIDIEAGRRFWAFQPVHRPPQPTVQDSSWPRTEIDRFILSGLESAQLRPVSDADRRTLIRRLYFDLTGLPPSPAQLHSALEDDSEMALERLVDQLLASPQFGVQWGRHWLDVARYADSNGGDFNATFHNAWKYRDYVIDAFNRDKPFDDFIREQIAGDLLPSSSDAEQRERIIATGFLMVGAKMLSERDKLKLTMDVIDEQVNTVGQAIMGLTLGCARCHDHKFDPLPTRDYYALAGIFKSTRTLQGESQQYVSTWPRRPLPARDEHVAAVEAYESSKQQLTKQIKQAEKERDSRAKTLDQLLASLPSLTVDDSQAKLTGVWKPSALTKPYFGTGYVHDEKSEKGKKFAEFTISVPEDGRYDVQLSYTAHASRADNVPVSIRHAGGEVEVTLNQQQKPPIDNLFASVGQWSFSEAQPATVTIATRGTTGFVLVDAVRLVQVDADGQPITVPDAGETPEAQAARTDLKTAESRLSDLQQQLKTLEANAPQPLPQAIAVAEAEEIGNCRVCIRGEHENLGDEVPRGMLQVASWAPPPQISDNSSGRLELANWLADARHPLTARVYVNRIWHHLLGRGIVASVDNFGKLGDRPSHPELLDWLASEFMQRDWSTKQLIRQIVLSRVYGLSTQHVERAWNADPDNRLMWRAHRRRLPAEAIRDSMLTMSGQLELAPDGSPVAGLGTLVTQNSSEEKKFEGRATMHRSAYLPIIRSEIPEMLLVFDFADPDLVTGRRSVTNVPAQALLLLNSPFVMEQAEQTAVRVQQSLDPDGDTSDLIKATYELVLSRPPTEAETHRAQQFLKSAETSEGSPTPLAQLINTLFASTEFRMLN